VFQLDFVCKDTLALAPATLTTPYDEAIPDGCAFRCRDNMTDAICKGAATDGLCDTQAATMRFQCPESCGVCKALELPAKTTTATYPKHACRHEDGDKYDYKERCSDWAANGECVKNFLFMSEACEASCGLCAVSGGAVRQKVADILSPPTAAKKGTGGKKKKKPKTKKTGAVAEEGAAQEEGDAPAAEAKISEAEAGAKVAAKVETPPKAAAAAASSTTDGDGDKKGGKKKKGWMSGMRDAVKSVMGGKKSAQSANKDEA